MEPDMYECRSRSWYVQAAASAKDIVILLDVSGSMTGLRKEIARNVVVNILETLTDNDFVQVLTVSGEIGLIQGRFRVVHCRKAEGIHFVIFLNYRFADFAVQKQLSAPGVVL